MIEPAKQCECTICKAKRLGLPDTLLLYFQEGSIEHDLVKKNPGKDIWLYEFEARSVKDRTQMIMNVDGQNFEVFPKEHEFDPATNKCRFCKIDQAKSASSSHCIDGIPVRNQTVEHEDIEKMVDKALEVVPPSEGEIKGSHHKEESRLGCYAAILMMWISFTIFCLGIWKLVELIRRR